MSGRSKETLVWITLSGFMFLLASALHGYMYSPHLDSPPPRWVHFVHGLFLLLYQTFDAVDGKQARMTGSTSPLGELFYHGCDALACALEALAFASTAMCGTYTYWFYVISAVTIYIATWEHYFTGSLVLPVVNGPTEGLMVTYMAHFFTAIVGAKWWAQDLGSSIPSFSSFPYANGIPTYVAVLFIMVAFAVIPTVAYNMHTVYEVVRSRNESMLKALALNIPFSMLLSGVLLWDYLSPYNLLENYPHIVIMGTGLQFGFLVSLSYLLLAIANSLTAWLNDGIDFVDEKWVLLGFFVYSVALYLHFATSVINEITTALGISCFRITRKEA